MPILRSILITLSILLNLLCLDAPLVAVVWQWLLASTAHTNLSGASGLALFFTAWLIYLIDRAADSTCLSPVAPKSARQEFCIKHRHLWLGLIALVAVADAIVILTRLDHRLVRRGLGLGAVAIVYLIVNLRFGKLWQTIPAKEICVGLLFAAGTLLPLIDQLPLTRLTIDFAAFLFATLCALNCVSIAFWERDLDLAQNKHSIGTHWPQAKPAAKIALVILALAAAVVSIVDRNIWRLAVCLSSSALLLFTLDYLRINRDTRTALADLVLLTPLVLFAIENVV